MGQEGGLALFATFVAFGVISLTLYLLVFRQPMRAPGVTAEADRTGARRDAYNNDYRGGGNNNRARAPAEPGAAAARGGQSKEDSNIDRVLAECATFPRHVAPSSQGVCRTGGSNLLNEGLLAFRHSRAAGYEQQPKSASSGGDVASQNRKDRARVLSRMLALEDSSAADPASPPHRGSTFVISIPAADVSCPKLRRVLYLFGTYYNLLVILVLPPGDNAMMKDVKEFTLRLRGSDGDPHKLAADILPDHRIVAASTTAGRIAFVRQLARAEIVLDFDSEVKTQLLRFGYRVINYKKASSSSTTDKKTSQLGSQLLS